MKKLLIIAGLSLCFATQISINVRAEGWQRSGNQWIYVDNNNVPMYNVWRKGADDKWRYISDNGTMAVNSWVDSEQYYVDEQGLLTINGFKNINGFWYFFDKNGKKVMSKWVQYNNRWYYFDDEGHMLTGWILDNKYYMGKDGAMVTGWQLLTPPSDDDFDNYRGNEPYANGDNNANKKWYYFLNNGRKYYAKGDYSEKVIDGKRYAFNDAGELSTGWVKLTDNADADISNYRLFSKKGEVIRGWYSTQPPSDLDANYNNDVEWFYMDGKGQPRASKTDKLLQSDFIKINGKSYLFNMKGNPVYGLQKVYENGNSDNFDYYYFGTPNQCYAFKGKTTLVEDSGDRVPYYFSESTGKGYTGIKSGLLYYKGRIQKADSDVRYAVISIPNGGTNINYLVGTSGRVYKNAKVKDKDGVLYKTNSSGTLASIDGSSDGINGDFNAPQLPDIQTN